MQDFLKAIKFYPKEVIAPYNKSQTTEQTNKYNKTNSILDSHDAFKLKKGVGNLNMEL